MFGSVLPHTLDIQNGLLFTEGGALLQLHRRDAALSGHVFTVGHCSVPPYSEAVLHCTVRTTGGCLMPSSGLLEGLKSTKCHLFQTSVPFLGHIVGRRGFECDPVKIEDVKSWPVPECLKSVRRFLGFVGYYRRFIQNVADIATPMVALTGKDVPFVWDPVCSTACHTRDSLIYAPILAFPTETGQYILDTDASNFGLCGVLSQIQGDVECVVSYCSRALRPSQRRYCTTKREMLAAVAMCIQFRSYLRGAKFALRTDHKSLVWLHRFKDMGV